jgi:hypothetical protein
MFLRDDVDIETHMVTQRHRSEAIRIIASAGILCGMLDGLSAIAVLGQFGIRPAQVFQGIARGLLGARALTAGAFSVALGIGAHFTIAIGAATVYYAISLGRPAVNDRPILAGAVFGAALHVFMNFVVIPLSAIGPRPIVWSVFLSILIVHIVVVGPSISLTVSRFARGERRPLRTESVSTANEGSSHSARLRNI